MKLPDRVYDIVKWIVVIVLPALATLYFALSGIWGFPYGEMIVGTIAAVTTFLGAVLGISTAAYNKETEAEEGFSTLEMKSVAPVKTTRSLLEPEKQAEAMEEVEATEEQIEHWKNAKGEVNDGDSK